ncbi:unnamed protein product [Phyllotreta striolata]|uniref:Odorant receptor n=1 Tax=Phyllotreta striolata TaxID=444603 RepID=A0A9N9XHZ3_PHYSR|nr:unnamed protein product [Phyllotreta striolata]
MTSEGILPKCKHLKSALPYIILGGVWPDIFNNLSLFWKIVYKMFSLLIFYSSVGVTLCSFAQFYILLQDRPLLITAELLTSFSLANLWSMASVRAYGIRKPIIKKLLKGVIDSEKRIYIGDDKDFIDIQNTYISKNNTICFAYSTFLSIYLVFYFLTFYFVTYKMSDPALLQTDVIKKPHIIEMWFPIDRDKYYATTIFIEGTVSTTVTFLVMGADCYSFSIQTYIVSQLKMLNHIFENLEKFELRVKTQLGCDENEAKFLVLRESIIFHQYILRYIDDYNSTMDVVALTEFILLSMQLAACVLPQILGLSPTIGVLFLLLGGIISSKFFIYYWFAEEITSAANDVTDSIYNSNWTEKPQKIKYMFILVMMRSMKMTGLSIGPLGIMSMRVYLMLIRSTYSFVALVHSFT